MFSNVGMGRFPLGPERIEAWARGTCTELAPRDFEDLLELSAVYCAACFDYEKSNDPNPWQPELTEEEDKAHNKAVERAMDIAMGVS